MAWFSGAWLRRSTLVQDTTEDVRKAMEKGAEVRGFILDLSFSIFPVSANLFYNPCTGFWKTVVILGDLA